MMTVEAAAHIDVKVNAFTSQLLEHSTKKSIEKKHCGILHGKCPVLNNSFQSKSPCPFPYINAALHVICSVADVRGSVMTAEMD